MSSDLVFLFSSRTHNPDRLFQGYFFHDTDYVFGSAGFEAFREATGLDRLVREDGCYVQVEKTREGYRFSADYCGYKKLFYFWDSRFWAVSNSLWQMAAHLREHHYPVEPNIPQVAAMATEGTFYPSGRGSFFSQMTCFDTIIRGVRLVPADCALQIGASGVRLEKTVCRADADDYRDRLAHFLSTWIARLRTVMQSAASQIGCDLTGGLDSRAVFGLLLNAMRDADFDVEDRLQIRSAGSGLRAWRDRAVATRLCEHFGLALNQRLAKKPRWLRGKAAYALWKDLCLGTYHPIYFAGEHPSGERISLGGGGGENHRPFYGQFLNAPSDETFVSSRSRDIVLPSARAGFEAALQETIDHIMEGAPETPGALAGHYRHFRGRFHAGLMPQYMVSFQPLASKLLDGITGIDGTSRYRNKQVLYDILYNLEPELLDLPFDTWLKRPGRSVRQHLTRTSTPAYPPGRCFIGETQAPKTRGRKRRRKKNRRRAIDYLYKEFNATKTDAATKFLGERYIRRAEAALERARSSGFSGPIQSKRVAVVMASALFTDALEEIP